MQGLRISVVADADKIRAGLSRDMKRQMAFASATAVNALARQAVVDLKAAMAKDFDRPTAWTLNAFSVVAATKARPTAVVKTRSGQQRGRPAWSYLQFEALGGARNAKGFELKLAAISRGQFVVPTPATPLDASGNIQRAWLGQVLNALAAAGTAEAQAKRTKRVARKGLLVAASGNRGEFFVGFEDGKPGGRPKGIYQLTGKGQVQKVLAFETSAPTYQQRFDPGKTVTMSVRSHSAQAFRAAIDRALGSARKK